MNLFCKSKKCLAVLTAGVHLLIYGFPVPLCSQTVSDTLAVEESTQDRVPETTAERDRTASDASSGSTDAAADTQNDYYGGGAPVTQSARRGMATSSLPSHSERKMLVDTAGVEKKREVLRADSLREAASRSAVRDSLQRDAAAPALHLGKRGKITALASSVAIVGAAAAYIWYSSSKNNEKKEDAVPSPPALPGI